MSARGLSIPARRRAVPSSLTRISRMGDIHQPPPKPLISSSSSNTGRTLIKKTDNGQPAIETQASHSQSVNIFSIGYEGKPIDAFIAILKQNGAERLIDVRQTPYSRKPGFSKKALETNLRAAGIEYVGIPELGTDKSSRDAHRADDDIAPVLKEYKVKLERNLAHYEQLKGQAREKPSAIMCYEEDFRQCHRQVIEERLEAAGFRVIHL
jgi:hypothetical protein